LQSWPLAGSTIFLKVIGHFSDTFATKTIRFVKVKRDQNYLSNYLEGSLLDAIHGSDAAGVGRRVAEVALDLGDAVISHEQPFTQQPLQHTANTRPVHQLQHKEMRAAARRHGDLDCVSARLTHVLQVQRLV
jgi:hypothetical protein